MHKSFFLLPILFIVQAKISFGYDIPKSCKEKKANVACITCTEKLKNKDGVSTLLSISEKINAPENTYTLFEKKARDFRAVNILTKNRLASMYRSLRDGKKEETYESGILEINNLEQDFIKLTLLSKEANVLQKKFNICLTRCSPSRRLEFLAEIEKVQKLKIALILGSPILANKHFENLMKEMPGPFAENDQLFGKAQFEETLKSALFDNIQTVLSIEDEYAKFESDPEKPIFKNADQEQIKKYNANLVNRFPNISEVIVRDLSAREVHVSAHSDNACYFAENFNKYTNKKEYQAIALDIGLIALPLALGPIGGMSGFGVELFFVQRLASWGLKAKEVTSALKAADLSLQGAMVLSSLHSIEQKFNQCQGLEANFIDQASEQKLSELNQCKKDLADSIFLSQLSSISMGATSFTPKAIELLKRLPIPKFKTPETIRLVLIDFGVGNNTMIKKEIQQMIALTKNENKNIIKISNEIVDKKSEIELFKAATNHKNDAKTATIITPSQLDNYQKLVAKDSVELLYIPGSDIPFLPNSVNKVGHIAFRIGDKVYHQTGTKGFKVETFDHFLKVTKKEYKVFGQVMQVSEKEKVVMESYFQKMYEKQLPYSMLMNNCTQAVCRAMSLASFEKINPLSKFDPVFANLQLQRSKRVVMKTLYNAEKDLTEKELKKATVNNRLAFYGVPLGAAAAGSTGTYEAVDFFIEYLNQVSQ